MSDLKSKQLAAEMLRDTLNKRPKPAAALAVSLVLTLSANVLRAASLFFVEAALVPGAQPWWHAAIGLAAFAAAAAVTLLVLTRLEKGTANSWAKS